MKSPLTVTFASLALVTLVACSQESPNRPLEPPKASALTKLADAEWGAPVHLDAPVSSSARELGPQLSPDGLSLYFGSDRAGSIDGTIDIWAARRDCLDCAWGTPVNININSSRSDGGPAFSADGLVMFFSSDRLGTEGGDDIWVASRANKDDDLGWGTPIHLGTDVNTPTGETGPVYIPALHAEGASLYFIRGAGNTSDIYKALVTLGGETLGPAVPVTELNDPSVIELEPSLSHNGKEIFFSSARAGGGGNDIWVSRRQNANEPWSTPENVGATINTAGGELTPGLSRDGETLMWSATQTARPSLGFQDIWMSTRTKKVDK